MIAHISGEVLVRRPDHVVIDTGGVGYHLAVSSETLRAVPGAGKRCALHAHLVAREDSLALYGFATEEEREMFVQLISVSGVGPKVGMAVLSGGPVREQLAALAAGDAKHFQSVPGIGKRTAERIILELREKVAGQIEGKAVAEGEEAAPRTLAREGLIGLGYNPVEAEQLLEGADGDTTEELISAALRRAGGGSAVGR